MVNEIILGDLKWRQLINTVHNKISSLFYSEVDVLVLLILIREIVDNNTSICELAHFIAHRNRDRGRFHEFLKKCIVETSDIVESSSPNSRGEIVKILNNNPVFSVENIFSELNDGLEKVGVAGFDTSFTPSLITYIICLLQDIKFVDKSSNKIGVTILALTSESIALLAKYQQNNNEVLVPIISVKISFSPVTVLDGKTIGAIPNDDCVYYFESKGDFVELTSKQSIR